MRLNYWFIHTTRQFVHSISLQSVLLHHTDPVFQHFFYQLFAPTVQGSILHSAASIFFFILNNFIFTVVGIVHFIPVQFSTFRTCTVFQNAKFHLENFLRHQIFYTTLWLRKFSTALKFLLLLFRLSKFFSASNYSFYFLHLENHRGVSINSY